MFCGGYAESLGKMEKGKKFCGENKDKTSSYLSLVRFLKNSRCSEFFRFVCSFSLATVEMLAVQFSAFSS